jgi:hypothetical protein
MKATTVSIKETYKPGTKITVKNSANLSLRKKNVIPVHDSFSEKSKRTIFINGNFHVLLNCMHYIGEVKPIVPTEPTPSVQPPIEPTEPLPPVPIQPPAPAPQIIPEPAQPGVPPVVPMPPVPPAPGSPAVPEVPFVPVAA